MNKKAIYILVGLNVLLVLLALVAFVIWRSSSVSLDLYRQKLDSYYAQNGHFPNTLLDLEGIEKDDINGTEFIYRPVVATGRSYNSYNGYPANIDSKEVCGYMLDHIKTDFVGLNPQTTESISDNKCKLPPLDT